MERNLKWILLLIAVILVVIGISMLNNSNYNIYYNEYSNEGYTELNFSDIQLKRYNEMINSNKISYLIGNLSVLEENEKITDSGIIQYAMLYAKEYDYRFEDNSIVNDNKTFIKINYLNKLIKELFNVKIDLTKQNLNIQGKYVELQINKDVITSAFNLYLQRILYNESDDKYIAYIYILGGEDSEVNIMDYDIKEKVTSGMKIRYKKNKNNINTILEYKSIEAKGEI